MFFGEQAKKFTPRAKLKDEEEFLLILKRIVQPDDKGMVYPNEDIPFYHYVNFLLLLLNIFFLEDLHRINFGIIIFPLNKDNFGIWAFADYREHVKVLESWLIIHLLLFLAIIIIMSNMKSDQMPNEIWRCPLFMDKCHTCFAPILFKTENKNVKSTI